MQRQYNEENAVVSSSAKIAVAKNWPNQDDVTFSSFKRDKKTVWQDLAKIPPLGQN